jgi:GcrA cell cycle regulator
LFGESNRESVLCARAERRKRAQRLSRATRMRRPDASGFAGRRPRVCSLGEATTMSRNDATWNSERVDALRRGFAAGLSCSRIAREIGVTRNAVIGKMNRLGLTRPRDVIVREMRARAAPPARPRTIWRPPRTRATIAVQHDMLRAAFAEPEPCPDIPINGHGCTLLELGQEQCRWPISSPGAADFCFCGNAPVKGLPYCAGHARMAYRPAGRLRSA